MIRKVLIVDDNQEMLFTLKDGLGKYRDFFKVLISGDGLDAISKLKKHTISLVVADVKMPRMDGISLMNHIVENYPGIPIILISAHLNSDLKEMVQRIGVVEYLAKPFRIEQLSKKITTVLRRQTNGGILQNVSSSMFLQLMEMEQKSCTIRLACAETGRNGVLFFKKGQLLDARVRSKQGIAAAYEIFSWETVNLSIENDCPLNEDFIKKDVQSIYLESLHRKDEAQAEAQASQVEEEQASQANKNQNNGNKPVSSIKNGFVDKTEKIRKYLFDRLGPRSGLENIYPDNSWEGVIAQMERLGSAMEAGTLELAYVRNGDEVDYIVIPEEEPLLLVMNSKCPRDRVLQTLMHKDDYLT
ncbi:MAG: response regulator [Desulfobacteraceae bacterium]|jgi:DNA-binding response OmpR family regulator